VAYEDVAPAPAPREPRVRRAREGNPTHQCSYCDDLGHNMRTCPKLRNASPQELATARAESYAKSRSGYRRRLAAGATASNGGDGA
jgi:hypothetical protein